MNLISRGFRLAFFIFYFILFVRFFEMDPAFQKLFPEFRDISLEEVENARALHGHAKRVMKGVEKAVSAMDDAESFAAYLEELGRRHIQRAMKPAYLDVSIYPSTSLWCPPLSLFLSLSLCLSLSLAIRRQNLIAVFLTLRQCLKTY